MRVTSSTKRVGLVTMVQSLFLSGTGADLRQANLQPNKKIGSKPLAEVTAKAPCRRVLLFTLRPALNRDNSLQLKN